MKQDKFITLLIILKNTYERTLTSLRSYDNELADHINDEYIKMVDSVEGKYP